MAGVDGQLVGGACGGTITRTWNVSDACGNPAITRTQIITVDDNIAPVLAAAPAAVTVELHRRCSGYDQLNLDRQLR